MGKVGIKVKEGNLTGKPTKIKPGMKVKLKTPTKKKSKKSFVLNGSPVYADPDEDDIFVGSGMLQLGFNSTYRRSLRCLT